MSELIARHTARKILAEIKNREANGEMNTSPLYRCRISGESSICVFFLDLQVELSIEAYDLEKINTHLKEHGWSVVVRPDSDGVSRYVASRT